MAQADGVESAKDARLWISFDGTTYTDISGAGNNLQPSGWAKSRAETNTFTGNNPIRTTGKNQLGTLTVTAVYTETDTPNDIFALMEDAYDNDEDVWLRWAPLGATTGNRQWTTPAGKLDDLNLPGIDASSANALMTGFVWSGGRPVASIIS